MLIAKNIYKKYGNVEVLKNVNLDIKKGEFVSIIGSSGAGKSTLLHILGVLDTPDKGEVLIHNINVSKLSNKKKARFRNHDIGFVFQHHNLLAEFTALENVCMPAWISGLSVSESMSKAKELMKKLNLNKRLEHKPSQLSGGEMQRVAVARALINDPFIVMADEPSGNLDSSNAEELHNLFLKLRDEINQTFIIVTHNNFLADIADRKLEMRDGILL